MYFFALHPFIGIYFASCFNGPGSVWIRAFRLCWWGLFRASLSPQVISWNVERTGNGVDWVFLFNIPGKIRIWQAIYIILLYGWLDQCSILCYAQKQTHCQKQARVKTSRNLKCREHKENRKKRWEEGAHRRITMNSRRKREAHRKGKVTRHR